jgi:hypothetical protein
MFQEYDVVKNKRAFENVPEGSLGTILICHDGANYYIVEFMNNEGDSLNVLTVSGNDLILFQKDKGNISN